MIDKHKDKANTSQRKHKVSALFFIIFLAMSAFLYSVYKTITNHRDMPSYYSTIHDRSFRGSIISADGYTLSSSQKIYTASIRGASIVPQKREVFIKLFSIYSDIPTSEIREVLKNSNGDYIKGYIAISREINTKHAMQLKNLAYKLRQLNVFQNIKNNSGIEFLYGLDIVENGEDREFPLKDVLSPVLGYVGKEYENKYLRRVGKKGLEKKYNKHITSKKDGYFRGKRDVRSRLIHDKNSIQRQRIDGLDLHLNISLAIQRRVELMLDAMKSKLYADEIIVGVMQSNTGKVLALASSERYNPAHIEQKDIPALNPKFSEYPYEAGSVLKPLSISIALDKGLIKPNTIFNTFNGRLKIGKRHWISDDDKFDSLSVTDIVVHSSNVGASQISWRLTGEEFREGLLKFGVAKPSGIDLSRDLPGMLKKLYKLNHQLHRASTSYGYGMQITFAQLLKAYSAFNNDGKTVTPRIVNYLEDSQGRHFTVKPDINDTQAISKKTAKQMHNILLEVVKRGTGEKAQYPGLEIGGKTGTAHIVRNGKYVREYHSSFYGFANDKKGNRYTIGVLVIRAKKKYKYFASQSAVPTFKNIVNILVGQNKLIPDIDINQDEIVSDMYKCETNTSNGDINCTKTMEEIEIPKSQKSQKNEKSEIYTPIKNVKKVPILHKIKKPYVPKVFKEPALPTTKPEPEQIQHFDNIEDLF